MAKRIPGRDVSFIISAWKSLFVCAKKSGSVFILLVFAGLLAFASPTTISAQPYDFSIARLQYDGGGDWYSDPSSIPNLINFLRENSAMKVNPDEVRLKPQDPELFLHPYLYMTGHGNIRFSETDVQRLRQYLTNGGFLHADDNYGMDESFRREMKKVFPEKEFVELPFDHPIYHIKYDFSNGPPKIHEHDGKPAQGFGLFHNERLVVFYTYETDLGDGWEDTDVHDDTPEQHRKSLQMGTNIVLYALTH
ncbi:MAG: DUF4159 domain-containing protein [Candidatus Marinimicrobia bacterium]|nr:DUF4159 domain-containing protein [Candidatus Neomarinimicrobiota bacterium]MCF7830134.1 DUF4159 domain-containing protein [Candidatus Neomarinimicrobiota bacterium]MCF7882211.1 DUF4159 domain-containing protein [Candidatus Neomarinimicrobiota bacterium]